MRAGGNVKIDGTPSPVAPWLGASGEDKKLWAAEAAGSGKCSVWPSSVNVANPDSVTDSDGTLLARGHTSVLNDYGVPHYAYRNQRFPGAVSVSRRLNG